jgi:protein-tyrosine-phosphatase
MMERKIKVLFVCIHKSARSQMAESFLKQLGGDRFEAMSAGIEPGTLNPNVVEAMKEIGIDIRVTRPKMFLNSSKKERCSVTSSQSAMKPARRDARYSPD